MNKPLKFDPDLLILHENKQYRFKDLLQHFLSLYPKVNHEIYRKVVKKVQRKLVRQKNASCLNKLESKYPRVESRPYIEETQDEEKKLKEHKLWLEREKVAQIEWKAKKEKEKKQQQREAQKQESKAKHSKRDSKSQEKQIDLPYHNPILNYEYSEQNQEKCTYFAKTGVCKYSNLCNKSHNLKVDSLTTLIFPGMYTNMLLGYELLKLDNDSDEALEYEESDILDHFKSFYDDVLSELKTFGKVIQFLVCSNCQAHLRGNVYVQYQKEEEANKAYKNLNGRYYAGKPIYCYFTHVKDWKEAVCGLFLRNKCDKGRKCNYMHVFENPYKEFGIFNSKSSKQKYEKVINNNWSSDEDSYSSKRERSNQKWEKENINSERKSLKHKSKKRSRTPSPTRKKHKR